MLIGAVSWHLLVISSGSWHCCVAVCPFVWFELAAGTVVRAKLMVAASAELRSVLCSQTRLKTAHLQNRRGRLKQLCLALWPEQGENAKNCQKMIAPSHFLLQKRPLFERFVRCVLWSLHTHCSGACYAFPLPFDIEWGFFFFSFCENLCFF